MSEGGLRACHAVRALPAPTHNLVGCIGNVHWQVGQGAQQQATELPHLHAHQAHLEQVGAREEHKHQQQVDDLHSHLHANHNVGSEGLHARAGVVPHSIQATVQHTQQQNDAAAHQVA